jgi:hypothetical protein
VRNGNRLRAKLYFKSWEEINAEMEAALVLFPSSDWRTDDGRFDIRQARDRRELARALAELSSDQLISRSTRNINNVLLSSYIKGYDSVKPFLNGDDAVHEFGGDRFADHKAFVGDESLAVYLKDVLLEINSSHVRADIEIADCQGSDSSNPLHLAMIQDYLLLAHQMVYVISSRTGLRRADIRFLSMIKKMGILDNIVFVINCDFSEHESIDDLNNLVDRIQDELSMLKPEPQLFTFSALFNLFRTNPSKLSDKDRLRFNQWQTDTAFVQNSDQETDRFEDSFYGNLARQRNTLLVRNHVERLSVILAGFGEWINLNQDVFAKDTDKSAVILKKIKSHQKRLDKIQSAVKKTLSGAMPEIKKNLQQDVHRYFDAHSGSVSQNLDGYIHNYALTSDRYLQRLENADFSQIVYLVFQDFKQAIDTYITETINPEMIRFIQSNENRIAEYFKSLILPFETMIEEASEEFSKLTEKSDWDVDGLNRSRIRAPELANIIKSSGLRPPILAGASEYSTRVKAEAIMRLGYYKAVRKSKSVFKKTAGKQGEVELKALENALNRMKRETARSIVFHLKDYRENLKFGYFFKLVEAVSENFARIVLEHFQAYFSDLSTTIQRIGSSQSSKNKARQILADLELDSRRLIRDISQIRNELEQAQ